MSTQYKESKEVPTTVLIARLKELARAVANGDKHELTMRVPAELDRDADLVLMEAARRLEQRVEPEAVTIAKEYFEAMKNGQLLPYNPDYVLMRLMVDLHGYVPPEQMIIPAPFPAPYGVIGTDN